jgi:hypothetical protein
VSNESGQITCQQHEGRALAERSADRRPLAYLYWAFGVIVGLGGDPPRSRELAAEAVRIADATGDMGVRLFTRCGLSWAYFNLGLLKEAYELNGR